MRHKLLASAILSLSLPLCAQTTAPSVAVDIAPLHSLVSQVMEGAGKPDLLIPPEASPHQYSLRPSQAKALSDANVVFWTSENLTPWLEKAMDNLAGSAYKVEMLDLEETISYSFREGATFEAHEHHDDHEGYEHHDSHEHHDDHEGHEHHDDHKGHEHHDDHQSHEHHDAHEGHEGHDHHGQDPHAWLDPQNAIIWINKIKETLVKQDPANTALYKRNAAEATAKINALMQSTQQSIDALGEIRFIVFHDAYQYFEKRFAISAAGAISLSDAAAPSPARIKEIRDTVKRLGVSCVFAEPQFNDKLVKSVFEGTNVATIAVIDPLGAHIATGSGHYQALIENILGSLKECK